MHNAHRVLSLLFPLGFALVAGCTHPEPSTPAAGGDQVAMGQALFAQKCAGCHGDSGQGGKAPPLVGAAALPLDPPATAKKRSVQFHTAADVFTWVKANMPANAPGSLTDEEYAAILAFDLKANGVNLADKTVDANTAGTIVLHP